MSMFTGYLQLGGVEIANSDRVHGYVHTADCITPSFEQEPCGTLQAALRDEPYDAAQIFSAPWYDPNSHDLSSRFYGVSAFDISGVHDSTRSMSVTQAIREGGIIGNVRHGTKSVRVKALLHADGEDALDYGLNWLTAALEPGSCGQHGDSCGLTDLTFLTTCPPEMPTYWESTDGEVIARNLFTNPRLVGDGTWAEVRRNLNDRPLLSASITGWILRPGVTDAGATASGRKLDVSISTLTGQYLFSNNAKLITVTPGEQISSRIRVRNTGLSVVNLRTVFWHNTLATDHASPTTTLNPGEVGDVVMSGFVVPAGETGVFTRLVTGDGGVPAGAQIEVLDGWTVEKRASVTGLFDGSTMDASMPQPEDFRVRWLGAANASESVMEIERVRGFASSNCVAGVSTKNSRPAMRLIPTTASADSYAQIIVPVAARTLGTALGTVTLDAPLTGTLNSTSRRLRAVLPEQLAPQPANAAGTYPQRLLISNLVTPHGLRFGHGGTLGSGDVWWTDIGLFAGNYDGPNFTGADQGEGEHPLIGYRWVGAVDNSVSEAYEIDWTEYPDLDEMDRLMRPVERYMHDVAVTSGPVVREYLGSRQNPRGMKAAEVEFTVTSERGYIYSRAVDVPLLATPDATETVQRNLFTNPTADTTGPLALGWRRNLIVNSSLETNLTGWSASGVTSPGGAAVTIPLTRAVGELRAVGDASAKGSVPAAASGQKNHGTITQESTVAAGGARVIIGIWGAVTDPSNTVTRLWAEYRIGTGAWLPLDEAANVAAAKGGKTYRSANHITLPVGATASVGVRFRAEGTAAFTMYADAAMLIEG